MHLGPYELGPTDDPNQGIYTGDARELAQAIPDESVDLIFCDPPYLKKFLPFYGWLAEWAARALRPGGWLFAYGAGEHIPDHVARLGEYLDYHWLFVLKHQNGWPRMWHKKLMSAYKPVMVYTKGHPDPLPWMATLHGDNKDKRHHEWGQGEGLPFKIVEMLTDTESYICDPCCGGGTVPAVCKMLGRHWLAFEIDPATADTARERVRNTQPPLFVPQPEQMALEV